MKNRHVLGLFAVLGLLLAALAACGSSSTPTGSQNVQVTLTGTTITSSVTNFSPGMSYHFTVTNNGSVTQAFAMMPEGMHMEHMSMGAIQSSAWHMMENIAPGKSATFDTFASSMMGHNFELACNVAGHTTGWVTLPMMISQ